MNTNERPPAVDEKVQNAMNIEDEIVQEISKRERETESLKEPLTEKDQALTEKDRALSIKDKEAERLRKLSGDK